jgi:cytochrome c oxidase assembly protein subunit 15
LQERSYNRALHWFAAFTAFCTFLLIIAGALVTSHDAGLSVPDWPTSFGHWPVTYSYFQVPLAGGVLYEHGHRIFAQFIGVLTIVLAVWTWRADSRPWIRKLGVAALGIVVAQGVLGGLTVLHFLPWAISTAHAALGQTFFCIAVTITLFTGRNWTGSATGESAIPSETTAGNDASTGVLAWISVAAVFVQLILGAAFRHHGIKLLPHLISAVVVTVVLSTTVIRVMKHYAEVDQLRRPANILLLLLLTQLTLGFASYITRVDWGMGGPHPGLALVIATVLHVAVGALLLATAVVLAIQTTRHLSMKITFPQGAHTRAGKAFAA